MSAPAQPSTPAERDRAKARLRVVTRGAIVAATGATVAMGIVVSHDHPGASAVGTKAAASTSSNGSASSDTSGSGTTTTTAGTSGTSSAVFVVHLGTDDQLVVTHGDVGWYLVVTQSADVLAPVLTARSFRAIGTTATVVVPEPADAAAAERLLATELAAIDLACSRFRDDSELQAVHAEAGRTVTVSELLFEALSVACETAERTGGAVDPTIGNAIAALGYDADLDEVQSRPPAPPAALGRVAGYQHVQLNRRQRTVRIPRGVRLDLGASAKALAADRAASRIAARLGRGHPRQPGRRRRRGGPRPGRWVADRHRPRVVHPGRARGPGGGDHPRRPGQLGHLGQDLEGGRT